MLVQPPWETKFWTTGKQDANSGCGYLANEKTEELQSGGIDPVHVFHNYLHWLPSCQRQQQRHHCFHGLLLLLLGREVAVAQEDREERGQQRYHFRERHTVGCQRLLQFAEFFKWGIVALHPQCPLQQVDDWIHGAVLIIG